MEVLTMTALFRIVLPLAVAPLLFAAAAPPPPSPLTVRVDATQGAPRLVVNGEPVRARMFWGGPGSAPIHLKAGLTEVAFEFEARQTVDNATLHFRFGKTPGTVVLDDIRIADLAGGEMLPVCSFEDGPSSFSREWTFWPPGAANTTGAIDVVAGAGRNGSGVRAPTHRPPR